MTGIAKDYLSKTTLAKKQQLIQPKIQNLKVSQAAMLKVIDDIKISLSPLVSLELTKKICELYKLLRTTYKKNRFKGNLSAKDEDDVPLFLKQAVSAILYLGAVVAVSAILT